MTPKSSVAGWLLTAAYRAALFAFPRDFRRRFGRQMLESFEFYRTSPDLAGTGIVKSIHAISEVVMQGIGERFARVVRRVRPVRTRGHLARPRRMGFTHLLGRYLGDARFAFRSFRRTPVFALTALAILTLGIGSSTAVFSVVNALVFRGLPFPDADRLVRIVETFQPVNGPTERRAVSLPDYRDWKTHTTAFAGIGIRSFDNVALTAAGEDPLLTGAAFLSPSFFDVLGASPAVGRLLVEGDDAPGNLVAVVGHDLWTSRWGADSSLVGRNIVINDRAVTVVGVARDGYGGAFGGLSLWLPFLAQAELVPGRPMNRLEQRGVRGFYSAARLRDGVSMEDAQRQIDVVSASLHEDGQLPQDRGAEVVSFVDESLGTARGTATVLTVAVGLVLLIACANVANLLLARQLGRTKELALRQAIGAGKRDVVRQVLVESVLLGVAGGVAGGALAMALTDIVGASVVANVPNYIVPTVDAEALAFAIGVSMITGLVFGLLPALGATKIAIGESLKATVQSVGRRGGFGTRRALVIVQIAVAIPLLVGSGLMIRSVANALAIDTGLEPEGVGVAAVNLPAARYDAATRITFTGQLQRALELQPGVQRATVASDIPLNSGYSAINVRIDEAEHQEQQYRVYMHSVSPGYFETLGIDMLQGREFDDTDRAGGPTVIIISEQMANRFWPDTDPVGRSVSGRTIVGVAENATYRGLIPNQVNNPNDPDIFVPFEQRPASQLQIAVRGTGPTTQLTDFIRAEVARLDPTLPVFGITTMADIVDAQVAPSRTATQQLGAFAGIAMILAVGGLFGIMMYTVGRRKGEIGIRMALGAGRGSVLRMFLGQAGGLVVFGLMAGLTLALGTVRLLESQLYAVGTTDPGTYLVAAVAFLAVGLGAGAVPAIRATRVDPLVSLRAE